MDKLGDAGLIPRPQYKVVWIYRLFLAIFTSFFIDNQRTPHNKICSKATHNI